MSTTGNTSGVYDFGGNAWEYVKGTYGRTDLKITEYLDKNVIGNSSATSLIGKAVRGSVIGTSSNLPVNGSPDARIGYRVTLHIN